MLTMIAAMLLAPVEAAAPTAKNDDPVVCRKSKEHQVGTRMKTKRKCMLKTDWDYIEKQTQREMQSLRDRHLSPGQKGVDRGGL
jgi:hypothetical protein